MFAPFGIPLSRDVNIYKPIVHPLILESLNLSYPGICHSYSARISHSNKDFSTIILLPERCLLYPNSQHHAWSYQATPVTGSQPLLSTSEPLNSILSAPKAAPSRHSTPNLQSPYPISICAQISRDNFQEIHPTALCFARQTSNPDPRRQCTGCLAWNTVQ